MTRSWKIAVVATALVAACGDDGAPHDADAADATADGTADAGMDGASDATLDGEPGFDAGAVEYPLCNPLLGDAACPAGERCGIVSEAGEISFVCRFDGTVEEGGDCAYSNNFGPNVFWDDCLAGAVCSSLGPGMGLQCRRPCVVRGDCRPGEECMLSNLDTPPLPYFGICREPDACDVLANTGCAAGERCQLARLTGDPLEGMAICEPAGERGEHESCQPFGPFDCREGYQCALELDAGGAFDRDSRFACTPHCDPSGGTGCAASETCVAFTAEAGVCTRTSPPALAGDGRPADVWLPSAHDGSTPLPLVVVLHGYGSTSAGFDTYLRLIREAERVGAYLILPDGNADTRGAQFWNATDACCDLFDANPDDSAYLSALVAEMAATYPIDISRVFLFGHSNGGFMSYRLACDRADTFAAIASLAGATYLDEDDCGASQPVSVLQLHGTADATIPIDGAPGMYPSARESSVRWATRAGCDPSMPTDGTPFDIDDAVDGPETTPTTWSAGCAAGVEVALWTMAGSGHAPDPNDDFTARVFDWLLAHGR